MVIQLKLPLLVIGIISLALTSALALTRLTVTVASDVGRGSLAFLFIIDRIVIDSLAFVQRLEALLVDGGEVDEDVFTTISGGDEAESLLGEKFDGSLTGHVCILLF